MNLPTILTFLMRRNGGPPSERYGYGLVSTVTPGTLTSIILRVISHNFLLFIKKVSFGLQDLFLYGLDVDSKGVVGPSVSF